MPDIKLITLVKSELKNGLKESDIYDKLTRDGHDKHQVIAAIDYVNKSKKNEKKPSMSLTNVRIILAVAAVLILIIAGYFMFFYHSPDPQDDTVADEGQSAAQTEEPVQDDYENFEDHFKNCEPSDYTSTVIDGSSYYYEIIGPKDGYCEVESRFIQNPDSDLVDVEMACLYDNGMFFSQAIQDNTRCSGRLYNLIMGTAQDEPDTCETACNNCRLGKQISVNDPDDGSAMICLDCRYDDDCSDGYECFTDNTCISRQIISTRPECVDMSCTAYPCEHCRTGYRTCQSSTIGYKNNKCIECGIDTHCKDGYRCEEYVCVIA